MTLTDTAGLRSTTSDQIEKEGIEIAKDELSKSHSIILVLDVSDLLINDDQKSYRLKEAQENDIKVALASNKELIVLLNKADLVTSL